MIEEVKKRNKYVQFADADKAGWAAVDEYIKDDLASDSDDEKRMRNAQIRASRKQKSHKRATPLGKRPRQQNTHHTAGYDNGGGSDGYFRGPTAQQYLGRTCAFCPDIEARCSPKGICVLYIMFLLQGSGGVKNALYAVELAN